MADRKLYHLINGEFVHDGMPSMRMPTYEEVSAHIAILNNVGFFDDPIAESVPAWDGLSNGKRSDAKQASLYDAMLAEIYAERDGEKEKVRNRRRADRKHKLTPQKRKEQELMRKDRMYGYAWNLDCPKVRFAPDSEPIKNRKYAEFDRIDREDWELEAEAIADDAEAEWLRNYIIAEYDRIERERKQEEEDRNLREWLKYA